MVDQQQQTHDGPFKESDEKIFGLSWLDTSFFETLFPSTPWQNVNFVAIFIVKSKKKSSK